MSFLQFGAGAHLEVHTLRLLDSCKIKILKTVTCGSTRELPPFYPSVRWLLKEKLLAVKVGLGLE